MLRGTRIAAAPERVRDRVPTDKIIACQLCARVTAKVFVANDRVPRFSAMRATRPARFVMRLRVDHVYAVVLISSFNRRSRPLERRVLRIIRGSERAGNRAPAAAMLIAVVSVRRADVVRCGVMPITKRRLNDKNTNLVTAIGNDSGRFHSQPPPPGDRVEHKRKRPGRIVDLLLTCPGFSAIYCLRMAPWLMES